MMMKKSILVLIVLLHCSCAPKRPQNSRDLSIKDRDVETLVGDYSEENLRYPKDWFDGQVVPKMEQITESEESLTENFDFFKDQGYIVLDVRKALEPIKKAFEDGDFYSCNMYTTKYISAEQTLNFLASLDESEKSRHTETVKALEDLMEKTKAQKKISSTEICRPEWKEALGRVVYALTAFFYKTGKLFIPHLSLDEEWQRNALPQGGRIIADWHIDFIGQAPWVFRGFTTLLSKELVDESWKQEPNGTELKNVNGGKHLNMSNKAMLIFTTKPAADMFPELTPTLHRGSFDADESRVILFTNVYLPEGFLEIAKMGF